MNKTVRKIINVVVDVIVVIILLISLLIMVLSITSGSSGVPNIFGFAPLNVLSNSMAPTLEEGDLIFSKILTPDNYEVNIGDVVTFPVEKDGEEVYNTHRVVDIVDESGVRYYITKGDNSEAETDKVKQSSATIVAKWTGSRIPKLGYFLQYIRRPEGFFFCILLPMIIFFVYEAIRVILNIVAYNKAKTEEAAAEAAANAIANAELTEEQKQRAIAEYLAQQNAQKEETPQDSDGGV